MLRIIRMKGTRALFATVIFAAILFAFMPLTALAAPNPPTITVNQVFNGPATAVFTYRLRPLAAGNPMPAGSTAQGYDFTITGSGSQNILMPSFTVDGVYRYELAQLIPTTPVPGYTYDIRVYTVEIYFDTVMGVDIVVWQADGTKVAAVTFTNSQLNPSDELIMVDPPIRKTILGTPTYQSIFTFRLVAGNSSFPMPTGSTNGTKIIQITGMGEADFGNWTYSDVGTYYYTIAEVNAGASGYTYDTIVYTITDTVTRVGGVLTASRVITNAYNRPVTAPLTFINTFEEGKPGPITGDDMNFDFYMAVLIAGGILAIGASLYLIIGDKRKRNRAAV